MSNESVIKAIESALSASPSDQNLLIHLASLLKEAGHAEKGLLTCQKLLTLNPVQVEGLKYAVHFANELGKKELVSGYETLLGSLGHGSNNSQSSQAETSSITHIGSDNNKSDQPPTRVRGAQLRLVNQSDSAEAFVDVEDAHIYLKDVGGMEAVKKRLELSFLAPLKNPELMKAYGKSVRGGLLLYGPPGCGKTYIARALAGELGARFITIGLNDILDMYMGESEKKLHNLFQTARRHAPAVLFIDEIDAIGQKRSQLKTSGLRTLVNQLLTEMDSLSSDNDDLFILAATNHPWDVDAALKRPGRFDRMVAVFPPDEPARHTIFEYYLKDKPLDGNIDSQFLVKASHLFSGADIAHTCNSAVEFALEDSIETGEIRPINMNDLKRAIQEHKASTRTWFETARNYAMFANESGTFDELLHYIDTNNL